MEQRQTETREPQLQELVSQCVKTLKNEHVSSLLMDVVDVDLTTLSQCALQFVSIVERELSTLLRSLFFHVSFSPVRSRSPSHSQVPTAELVRLVELLSATLSHYKTLTRARKDEPSRSSAMYAVAAQLDMTQLACVMRAPLSGTQLALEELVGTLRERKLERTGTVAMWALGVYGLLKQTNYPCHKLLGQVLSIGEVNTRRCVTACSPCSSTTPCRFRAMWKTSCIDGS